MADRIDAYLARLRRALRVSLPLREQILAETEDHLREGAEREQERGLPPDEAQRRVIARFGDPEAVAPWWSEVYPREEGGGKMWQRFTERARRAVFFAQEEAARFDSNMVDTEHLLLGLLRESDSVAGRLLEERLGISLAILILDTEKQVKRGSGLLGQDMQLTPTAKHLIDLAYEEARSLWNNYIGTEHLLLGLIREEEGLGGLVLRGRGADLERTRRAVRAMQEEESEETLIRGVKTRFQQAVEQVVSLSSEAHALIQVLNQYEAEKLVEAIVAHLQLTEEQRREVVAAPSPRERLKRVDDLLRTEAARLELRNPVQAMTEAAVAPPAGEPPAATDKTTEEERLPRAQALASLAEGQVHPAVVQQVTGTGAVVSIVGVGAWLPQEEMSWPPVRHPADVVRVGEEIEVMVLHLDRLRGKVVVGLRQLVAEEGEGEPGDLGQSPGN